MCPSNVNKICCSFILINKFEKVTNLSKYFEHWVEFCYPSAFTKHIRKKTKQKSAKKPPRNRARQAITKTFLSVLQVSTMLLNDTGKTDNERMLCDCIK